MSFRVLVAFFSFVTTVLATALVVVARYGEKNETWTKFLIAIAVAAAVILVIALLW
jgi:type IV secretory pathway VirB6-like protein